MHSRLMRSTQFMKRTVSKMDSKIDAVGVQVTSGFQVGFQNQLRHLNADRHFTSAFALNTCCQRLVYFISNNLCHLT